MVKLINKNMLQIMIISWNVCDYSHYDFFFLIFKIQIWICQSNSVLWIKCLKYIINTWFYQQYFIVFRLILYRYFPLLYSLTRILRAFVKLPTEYVNINFAIYIYVCICIQFKVCIYIYFIHTCLFLYLLSMHTFIYNLIFNRMCICLFLKYFVFKKTDERLNTFYCVFVNTIYSFRLSCISMSVT